MNLHEIKTLIDELNYELDEELDEDLIWTYEGKVADRQQATC
jgi:hypothetical protein